MSLNFGVCFLELVAKRSYLTAPTPLGASSTWSFEVEQLHLELELSQTGPTSQMSSFQTLSLLVCPQIQRNIRISATLSCWTRHPFVGQHSTPYNIAGRIAIL
jgi:hypothetical protein